ncbi:MAG: hypothetical protein FJW30_01665 [Acidobacteria bacterium]|nr:hypothetical protein [Acidobacteriota bacterium]
MRVRISGMRRAVLFGLAGVSAWACSCSGWPSAHEAWRNSKKVFTGEVIKTDPAKISDSDGDTTAWLRVVEPFKGTKAGEIYEIGQGGTSCDWNTRAGQKVLFYLIETEEGGLRMPRCHRSTEVSDATDDLAFLRALPHSASRTRISGLVFRSRRTTGGPEPRMNGIQISIEGEGLLRSATTNGEGFFELLDLPPGTYRVSAAAPKGWRIEFRYVMGSSIQRQATSGTDPAVGLGAKTGVSVNFTLVEDTSIGGRVVSPEGQPIAGVCLDLAPVDGENAQAAQSFGCTDADGRYQLREVPVGAYLVSVNRMGSVSGKRPFGRIFYPGTARRQEAGVVQVDLGAKLTGMDIRIPGFEPTVILRGRVVFRERSPAPRANVKFRGTGSTEPDGATAAADGSFTISLLRGASGELVAEDFSAIRVRCRGLMPGPATSHPLIVTAAANRDGIELRLQSQPCPDSRRLNRE